MGNNFLNTLKRRSDFVRLSQSGKKVFADKWLILAFSGNSEQGPRIGWTIPKYVGNAVLRNKLKRWCREFFRKQAGFTESTNFDLNLVFRKMDRTFYKNLDHDQFKATLSKAVSNFKKANGGF